MSTDHLVYENEEGIAWTSYPSAATLQVAAYLLL